MVVSVAGTPLVRRHIGRDAETGPMRASTLVILVGALVFVLPIPGTFVLGALLVLAGLVARLFGL
ncbi:hypothetical protein C463_01846 [Halorubrum californiense DSM 19288]|uniref:Uncharacterized protein n=1 Tax=Halorubrum californiense DSM 19288 TaxID=1227465 RepID=M0EJS8_9EURY|nr:hypothetical protein C463_01846 [Halorubrum californiense DSM 19288]